MRREVGRRRAGTAFWLFLMTCVLCPAQAGDAPPGFSEATWTTFRPFEETAAAVPTPEKAKSWLRTLTEEPHVAGTPADYDTAVWLRDKLRGWGWTAELVEYECLINYPTHVSVELVRPTERALPVIEAPFAADKDSASPAAFPAFHGYGASGEATAQVVFANYGRPEDFAALDRLGVDVRGKIVLVRYGGPFRGLKVRNAQKRGAVGVLIYSDPLDDGYARGDVYPVGPFRPGTALQRGSVQFLSYGPGDPTTPGWPSVKGAKRLPFDPLFGFPLDSNLPEPVGREPRAEGQARSRGGSGNVSAWERQTGQNRLDYFAAIPSLPISYDAASPILEALAGPTVPKGWQGGLPFAYHVGPGPAEIHISVRMDYKMRPIWNVLGRLEGAIEPERWVIVSNHRDAWVYGAVDPSSGTATTMEMCRALGEAAKAGWKPRRTIVYASWDAEEYGLVGSTEWAEEMAESLKRKAVMVLNVDAAVGGHTLSASGIPSLRDLFLSAARDVVDLRSSETLADAWTKRERDAWASEAPVDLDYSIWLDAVPEAPATPTQAGLTTRGFTPRLEPIGSGSDYTVFVDHLGVPALDIDFKGSYGVYHSIYDNFYWMEKFGDPEFLTHATAARLYTRLAMRAASADVVPLTFSPYADDLREHLNDLRRSVVRKQREKPGAVEIANLPALIAAIRRFGDEALATDAGLARLRTAAPTDAGLLARINDSLVEVEHSWLNNAGLPGRPWFRHTIFAPGLTTGYAAWPLPGLRQAVEENNASMMAEQSRILTERIDAATAALKRVTSQLPKTETAGR
jgi:N-acetylated-alpha-linked acidic dipeptidase